MYQIRLEEEAVRDLEKLDKAIARRIVRKISWLAENIENIQPKGLRADLSKLSKLREGDYRIIYEILKEEQIIIIYFIGHRSEVYKRGRN
jgi:mRNA interferase RelE/StbE